MMKLAIFFHQQSVDEAGDLAIRLEKLILLLWGFRVYFLIVSILSIFTFNCFFAFRLLLDLYIFIFGSICLIVGFYGSWKRREGLVGLYIGLSVLCALSSLLFLIGALHVYENAFELLYCLPSAHTVGLQLPAILAILDIILYLINFILMCLSFFWAVRLTILLRSSDSVGYGKLGSDDFNAIKNNYEFNPHAESLFDSDSEISLGTSDEDDDQPLRF